MWLGSYRNRKDKPLRIEWVKSCKSLGIIFSQDNTDDLNWIPCIDKFRKAIMAHDSRNLTIMGRVAILNYIGYSKLWHKSMALMIPDSLCKRENGKFVDIKKEPEYFTKGFIWGFCPQSNSESENNNSNRRTKQPLICK